MDFVGYIDSVGFWAILSGIGAGGIERHLQGWAWWRVNLHDQSGHRQGGCELFNVIVLPGWQLCPVIHVVGEVVMVTGFAAQFVVAWDGAIAGQDFHPTEH